MNDADLLNDSGTTPTELSSPVRKISVLMCDIDFFKKINDTYGHLVGDRILVQVSEAIKLVCRSTDSVVRYGGEEFAVILPETAIDGACIAAEKIRKAVEMLKLDIEGKTLKVTISIGVSENTFSGETIKEILQRSDLSLYKAKENGRNNVIAWHQGCYFPVASDGSMKHDSLTSAS
jgi:diguanylate cyclase (GGDEF)-like protein